MVVLRSRDSLSMVGRDGAAQGFTSLLFDGGPYVLTGFGFDLIGNLKEFLIRE